MIKINKRIKRLSIIFLSVFLFVSAIFLGVRMYFRIPVKNYVLASEKAFKIPEIDKGFVPQGFCYDKEKDLFLTSGYSSKDEPSTVHAIDKKTGKTLYSVQLLNQDGTPHTGHAGGIAQFKDWVYIAGSSSHCLYVYSYSEILSGAKQVKAIGKFSLEVSENDYLKASFVFAEEGKLFVGEFYREPNYQTLDSHKVTSLGGEKFGGIALEFILREESEFGILKNPVRAYALPDQVQGVCYTGDEFYLSTSYGLKHSYVYKYEYSRLEKGQRITVLGREMDVFIFTESALLNSYKIMPMSEEILVVDGKLYVMSEFACNKYILGKFTGSKWCYVTNLSLM